MEIPSTSEILLRAFDQWVSSKEPRADTASAVLSCFTKALSQRTSATPQEVFYSIPYQIQKDKLGRRDTVCVVPRPSIEDFIF